MQAVRLQLAQLSCGGDKPVSPRGLSSQRLLCMGVSRAELEQGVEHLPQVPGILSPASGHTDTAAAFPKGSKITPQAQNVTWLSSTRWDGVCARPLTHKQSRRKEWIQIQQRYSLMGIMPPSNSNSTQPVLAHVLLLN